MRSFLITLMLFGMYVMARGQTEGYDYRYWFDFDPGTVVTGHSGSAVWHLDADLSGLTDNMHAIHVQVTDGDGKASSTLTRYFVKVGASDEFTTRYWFDNDFSTLVSGKLANGVSMIDVSHLTDGFHRLTLFVEDDIPSRAETRFFLKLPQTEAVSGLTCLAFVDNVLYKQETVSPDGGWLHWNFDVCELPVGLHRLQLMAITPSGAATSMYSSMFLRMTTQQELDRMKLVYFIDGGESHVMQGNAVNGAFHFDVDVESLTDGLHRISYMLSDTKGNDTRVNNCFFFKTPLGGNGITQYEYWLNEDRDNRHQVTLDERITPYQLISLLPVESQPLRSCNFQFELTQGVPTMYARNTFHARFFDASGRFVTQSNDYVDYNVSQAVTDITPLGLRSSLTVSRPGENVVKWFSLTAERGDKLSFKLDRAATLQLFDPSGMEVYHASGAESVEWGELYAEANGTYYLALHDVTATSGSSVTLSYEHLDRYCVLRQDIATVGNGGPSTVTFQGNGFDELQGVDLVLGSTVIASSEIATDDKAVVSVKWTFADAPLGQYKAVFHFAEGNIERENCITVDEAVPVRLNSTVKYASSFLVSRGNTYSYKVQNQGNMTAYDRQMQLTVYASDPDLLSWVTVDGVEPASFTEVETFPGGFVYGRRYELTRTLRPGMAEPIDVKVKTKTTGMIYVDLDGVGGPSEAVTSVDPNDIYGYQDADGDKTLYGLEDLWYTIEFENDSTFATASAHEIHVIDQLNPQLFDLSTFSPTRIRIGDQEVKLSDDDRKQGVVTISMQPRIHALAQVEWTLDQETGIVQWHISSLDPMTVEPTTNPMDGVLPVNTDGNGIGQLSFDIRLKPGLKNETEISNKATIVFDENESIETPTWTNVVGLLGDANGDKVVDTQDAIKAIQYYLIKNPADFNPKAANMNDDKVVDTQDAIKIIKIYLHNR